MIPAAYVTEWREHAPWPTDEQVEQDLIITRALVELYQHPIVRESLAFRGGTALAKLFLRPPPRYSEDIDLVQIRAEPIGPTLNAMREKLDRWLGDPSWRQTHGRVKLIYRLKLGRGSESRHKLKLEINTREHESAFGLIQRRLSLENRWFTGVAEVTTYELDELLATKLRALYQRKKGRDLFDLDMACRMSTVNPERVVSGLLHYLSQEDLRVSREDFEANISAKILDSQFLADVSVLVSEGARFDAEGAAARILGEFIAKLGESR